MPTYFALSSPPFIAANFYYFRIPREKWILMLTRLSQMGATMITASVPWGFHEFEQGTIDLSGNTNPRRDLVGLLDICATLKLTVLLRLDPRHTDINVLNDGLPHWLSPDAPDFDSMLATAFNAWIQAASKVLTSFQWSDGPLVALHIDRTIDQQPVYSQELTEVRWPIWLRKRYKGIDVLNEAYASNYRSASNVPFPQRWSDDPTRLEQDAREFLAEVDEDTRSKLEQTLSDAGWQIPIYPAVLGAQPELPTIQAVSLSTPNVLDAENTILALQNPIQIDPDPTDVGHGISWANDAPIHSDGSVRRTFWAIRHQIWMQWGDAKLKDGLLRRQVEDGGLVSVGRDVDLKISVTKDTKPTAYRLALNGKVAIADNLKVARNKLSGPYLLETETDQTDFIFYLNDPAAPLAGFLLSYLQQLQRAQQQRLSRAADQAAALQHMLEPTPTEKKQSSAKATKPTSYTIAEARRGLSEADRILRKAISSIGGLEAGFDIMLDRGGSELPQPAEPSTAISPEIFEGRARDILITAGQACAEIMPILKKAAKKLQKGIDAPDEFTVERYQQNYDAALTAAETARETLLQTIADLRLEMASETLPLVAWRVHNQIAEIVESLRSL